MLILREPEIATSEILEAEIRGAILRLKNGIKSGVDFISAEIYERRRNQEALCAF